MVPSGRRPIGHALLEAVKAHELSIDLDGLPPLPLLRAFNGASDSRALSLNLLKSTNLASNSVEIRLARCRDRVSSDQRCWSLVAVLGWRNPLESFVAKEFDETSYCNYESDDAVQRRATKLGSTNPPGIC